MTTYDPVPPDDGDGPARTRTGPSPVRRVLTSKVPLWLLLAVAAAVGMILSILLVVQQQSAIELDPVVGAAERIDVSILVCNSEIDRLRVNPRASELDLESLFHDEGAGVVDVTVDRRDCPEGPGTSPEGVTTSTAPLP